MTFWQWLVPHYHWLIIIAIILAVGFALRGVVHGKWFDDQ